MAKPDVIKMSRELIEGVRELLSLSSTAAAAALLRHFKWNKERLTEAYFANPEKTLRDVGMGSLALEVPPPARPDVFKCNVCLDEVSMGDTFALGCGHRYCKPCWADHLEVQVAGGPNCVFSHCMYPKCYELCHEECFSRIVQPATFERYKEFLHRSFIDQNPNVKWCPNPGCENSVKCDRRGRRQPVACACGFVFCFQCADADIGNHLPASCEAVKAWNDKNRDESENVKWLMANTKRCPQCQKHIEKNGGCMHMTCRKEMQGCGHEFCWLCRGPWKEHGSATGGYYACNKYDASGAKKDDLQADAVKTELDQYMFYFHRFNAHRSAMTVAIKQRAECPEKCGRLQKKHDIRNQDTKFLEDTVVDLHEHRRVLMWSYCYGYHLKLAGPSAAKEYTLYEDLQEQVEKHCELLSSLYEKPEDQLNVYNDFVKWREEILHRTKVVNGFVAQFVKGVSEGLTEDRF